MIVLSVSRRYFKTSCKKKKKALRALQQVNLSPTISPPHTPGKVTVSQVISAKIDEQWRLKIRLCSVQPLQMVIICTNWYITGEKAALTLHLLSNFLCSVLQVRATKHSQSVQLNFSCSCIQERVRDLLLKFF